jgi:hypothetical protein
MAYEDDPKVKKYLNKFRGYDRDKLEYLLESGKIGFPKEKVWAAKKVLEELAAEPDQSAEKIKQTRLLLKELRVSEQEEETGTGYSGSLARRLWNALLSEEHPVRRALALIAVIATIAASIVTIVMAL